MRPFCAAYYAALEAVGSPLVDSAPGGATITAADLIYALEVCSSPVDRATLNPAGTARPRTRLSDYLRLIHYHCRAAAFERLVSAWRAYYTDYVSLPVQMDTMRTDEGGGAYRTGGGITGPMILARVCSVIKQYSLSEYRAWTMPYGLLIWMDEQGRELEGGGRPFWNEEHEAALDAALAQAEQRGAELLAQRKRRGR